MEQISSLARDLRQRTQDAHSDAENSTYIVDLMSGRLGVDAFIALQEQALLFYSAIEAGVDALQSDPRVAKIADRRLDRAGTLRHDLEQLGGRSNPEEIEALPATAEYVAELEKIAREGDAAGLIAHHYVRYLGDLSGGQVIARKMTQLLGVAPEALTFYAFPELGKLKPYKDEYRENLDALQVFLDEEERAHLIESAGKAFLCNQRVFRDLGVKFPPAAGEDSAEGVAHHHAG